jgi:hypothetical protein
MLGPFYKENFPFKQRLGEGIEGERLIITGKSYEYELPTAERCDIGCMAS